MHGFVVGFWCFLFWDSKAWKFHSASICLVDFWNGVRIYVWMVLSMWIKIDNGAM